MGLSPTGTAPEVFGEPFVGRERLRFVVRRPLFLAALLVVLAVPARAQEGPVALAGTAGFAGFVASDEPIEVAVTISADVFFAGDLEVRVPTSTQSIPVEVPAGSEKTYTIRVGLPVGSTQVRLRLFEEGETNAPAASASINLKAVTDQPVVAVVGSDELTARLNDVSLALTEREVVAAPIEAILPASQLNVARFLVVNGELSDATQLHPWITAGGRAVVETSALAGLGLELGTPIATDLVTTYRLGAGWVAAVENIDEVTEAEWGAILTPAPYQTAARDAWQSPELSLMQSAASGGDQRVPTIPWLLAALVGYAVLVGPVNFFLLTKFGRREMAWVTIPILAILGVAGFWIAGRQRLQTHVLNHGTVIVASEEGITGSTATVIAVGRSGRQVIRTEPSWTTYPFAATIDQGGGMGGGPIVPAELTPDGGFAFDLESLTAAGIQSQWTPSSEQLPQVEFSFADNEVEISVDNDTPYEFWAWGIAARGRAGVAPESLASGATGTESVRPGVNGQMEFGSVGDAVINERQLWEDPFIWNRIGTLGTAGSWELGKADTYFFGFSDDVELPIGVDGAARSAQGTTLVLIPFDLARAGGTGSAVAHLIDAGNASWVDYGPGYFSVQSKKMTIGWVLGAEVAADPSLEVTNMFGEVPRHLEIYDWTSSTFVDVEPSDSVDLDRFRSATGEVVLQAWADTPENIDVAFEIAMSPYRLHVGVVRWESSASREWRSATAR